MSLQWPHASIAFAAMAINIFANAICIDLMDNNTHAHLTDEGPQVSRQKKKTIPTHFAIFPQKSIENFFMQSFLKVLNRLNWSTIMTAKPTSKQMNGVNIVNQ